MGVSAWFLLKGLHVEFAKKSLTTALGMALAASLLELPLGHLHAIQVAHTQPEKLAAIEGLFKTQSGAPVLLFGIPDGQEAEVHFAIRIPKLLSLLAFGRPDAEVDGLNEVPRRDWPPIVLTFYPFHLMVLLGLYFIGLTLLGIYLLWRKMLFENRLFLWLALFSIPLPFITNELGWITAEVGRQPWIVYHLLRTSDAVSVSVPAWQIAISLFVFAVLYAFLFYVWLFLIRRTVGKGPEPVEVAK
jgi:cytochrome bd ubiquinol oxidase subunit I